ncbi:MAG TPA: glucosamine-6-phosphate deaminase [Planctomycetaceae bacterium]|nr:glucosamine-6-phosphate deaminase [Planctomycetaceae bacterium]
MQIVVANDRDQLGLFTAEEAAKTLRSRLDEHAEVNLVIATGSSQFEVLDRLAGQEDIDWSRVNGMHLDEYVGIPKSHTASFCGYLEQRFVSRVPLKSFHYLDGTMPPNDLASSANAAIDGRSIHLLLCGIGENGHLAFNDPPADFDAPEAYKIVELDEACRRQQVGEGWFDSLEQVPLRAVSMSVPQILKAERILCSVPDRRKAEAVKGTVEGDITPSCPGSALQKHGDVTLILDPSSASLLSEASRSQATDLPETSPA